MRTSTIQAEDLRGVFAVPPLARRSGATRALDFDQNDLIVRHLNRGGITRLIYGGNAFLYHLTLAEYEALLDWLTGLEGWVIPSVGPAFGRAMDQAALLRHHGFPCVMMLPCSDPRDAEGLDRGYREFAAAADTKLILYLKDDDNFGTDRDVGLDIVGRLVDEGVCVGVKYAVVRADPLQDTYLENLLRRVDRRFVISGIGERPAIVHLRDWKLPGFTTGSGCVAPDATRLLFEACGKGDFEQAARLQSEFIPLEDLRDRWGPAKVLHSALELAGIARTGAVPPYLSLLSSEQMEVLSPVARNLFDRDRMSDKL